jgi:hypothetical protein
LVRLEVCRLSGLLPTPACPYRRWEWFLAGTQPVAADTFFREVRIDKRSSTLAAEGTAPAYIETRLVLDLPPEFHLWAREEGLPLLADVVQAGQDSGVVGLDSGPTADLRVVYPDPNAVFYLSSAIPLEAQRILVRVVNGDNYGRLTLWLDGRPLTTFEQPPYEFWWQLEPGEHQFFVTVMAFDGSVVTGPVTAFTVRAGVD